MRIEYPAIKPLKNHASKAYADIVAHTNDVFTFDGDARSFCQQNVYAMDDMQKLYGAHDLVTSGHETIHQINSEIANSKSHRDKSVGLYALNDIAWVLDEPKPLTIQKAAKKVPQEWRGGVLGLYQLYMVSQAASWGDRPYYMFDEWIAYTNGSIVAVEASLANAYDDKRWDSIHGAVYFSMFSLVTVSMVDNPPDDVIEFVKFQLNRVNKLVEVSQDIPNLARQENVDDWARVLESPFFEPFAGGDTFENYDSGEYL